LDSPTPSKYFRKYVLNEILYNLIKKHRHLKPNVVLPSRHVEELQAIWNTTGVDICWFGRSKKKKKNT
jgi:hypothetical protein